MNANKRSNILRTTLLCGPLLLIVVLLGAQIVPVWYVTPDSGVYLELGRNLAAGRGYIYNDEKYFGYPPVFPSLLAIGIRLFGDNLAMMRALIAITTLAFLAAAWGMLRRLVGSRLAILLVLLFGLGPLFIAHTARVLSDLPGSMMAALALLAVSRVEQVDHRRGRPGVWTIVATLLTLLAAATRIANTGVLAGIILYFFIFRRDRFSRATLSCVLPIVLIPLLFLGFWFTARFTTPQNWGRGVTALLLKADLDFDQGRLGPLGLVGRLLRNAWNCFTLTGELLVSPGPSSIAAVLSKIVSGLFALGFVVSLIRRRGLVEAFTLGMLAALFSTPFPQEAVLRYLIAVGPFLVLYVYEGVAWLVRLAARLNTKPQAVLAYSGGLVLLVPVGLSLAGLSAFGDFQHPLGSPRLFALSIILAAGVLVGFIGIRRVGRPTLALLLGAGLVLALWIHHAAFRSIVWVKQQRAVAREGAGRFMTDERTAAIVAELERRADVDDAVASSQPTLYRGLTGLKAFWYPTTRDEDALLAAFERGEWIIIDLARPPDRAFAAPVLEAHADRFELVAEAKNDSADSPKPPVQLWRRITPSSEPFIQ